MSLWVENIYKEIFHKTVKEKCDEIKKISDEIDHNDLMYYFKNNTATKDFNYFENGIEHFRKIKPHEIMLEDTKELQNIVKTNPSDISKENFKSEEQKSALQNIKLLYKSRQAVIKLFNEYTSVASEANYKTKYGEALKLLTPKKTLQRIPIVLAQVKAGNTSKKIINEIRQIIYSLYQSREITKKVYNNITNSIKAKYKNEYYICEF